MKLQLWRNATLQLAIHDCTFLIDPMLGKKGSFGIFPWTDDKRENPLVELPFSDDELKTKLTGIDAVLVSHLHPDHWDETAINLIDKNISVICPATIRSAIAYYGFQQILPLQEQLTFRGIKLYLTDGQHGTGEIGEKMGRVNGFVFQYQNETIYVAGDTIWCQEVREAIDNHHPKHIIVAGGAATFAIGKPVTMTGQDIKALALYASHSNIWITHLEAISPCREGRPELTNFLRANHLKDQCKILHDGEEVQLAF